MKKKKHTHSVPINFVYKPASKIKSKFSCIEKGSIKSTYDQSKYKANLSKKNILQIINQSREIINRKQLLVSVANLKFTAAISSIVRRYGFSYFRTISPWGLQISDWHHRIQASVAKSLPPTNLRFVSAKVCYASPSLKTKGSQIENLYLPSYLAALTSTNLRFVRRFVDFANKYKYKYKSTICKKICTAVAKTNQRAKKLDFTAQSQKDSNNIILSISGGQDSIFLLFCLSFFQSQIDFKPKIIWCNHFWQKSSFYTALHLTKSALAFSSPIIEFLPFNIATSQQLYQSVTTTFCLESFRTKKNQGLKKPGFCGSQTNLLTNSKYVLVRRFICKLNKSSYKSSICTCTCKLSEVRRFVSKASPNHRFVRKFVLVRGNKICRIVTKTNQSKAFTFYISFPKRQSKHEFYTKMGFYGTTTEWNKKKPKGYKKFIKEISETRARNWRHITIERACTFYGSTLCLYGHTLSDRVETILFNLIRGTKNKNCQALPWKRRHSTFCYNRFYPTFEQVIKNTHIHFV